MSVPQVSAAAPAELKALLNEYIVALNSESDSAYDLALAKLVNLFEIRASEGQAQTSSNRVVGWEERMAGDRDYDERTAMLDEIAALRAAQLADSIAPGAQVADGRMCWYDGKFQGANVAQLADTDPGAAELK